MDIENFTFISHMTTTQTYTNLNISVPGYYYRSYTATDGGFYSINFKIVFKVGNPTNERTPQEKVSYTYDTVWKDQLDSYTVLKNGVSKTSNIVYDNQGNPTSITNFLFNGTKYNHANLSWDGRQLTNIKVYSSSDTTTKTGEIWYNYNDQGIRVSKKIDYNGNGYIDEKYEYSLSGDLLISETVSSFINYNWVEDYQIIYIYDYDGSLIGFNLYENSNTYSYLYIKNIQGDITKIIEPDGTVVVEYFYDAYGKIVRIDGSLKTTIGEYNSFGYRSYKYDSEINMYYLNSRYYNPEIGRFINADGLLGEIGNIQSTNMYAYCANNPVMYLDPSGFISETWKNIIIGSAVILTLVVLTCVSAGTLTAGGAAMLGALLGTSAGGLTGVLAAATVGSIMAAAIGGIAGGVVASDSGDDFWNGFSQGFKMGSITGAIAGGLGAFMSPGVSSARLMQGFLNGSISAGITAFQTGLNGTFTVESLVVSFGFGMLGGSVGANLIGLKAAITGFGLAIAESAVSVIVDIYAAIAPRASSGVSYIY
jgi:RHS repeat-associated protein